MDRGDFITKVDEEVTVEKKTKSIYLMIDSRDRNKRKDRDPNSYTYKLKEPLLDILSINLYYAQFPTPSIINSGNNLFYIRDNPLPLKVNLQPNFKMERLYKSVAVPSLDYQQSEGFLEQLFTKTLSGSLTLSTGSNITVDYDPLQKNYLISSDLSSLDPSQPYTFFCPQWNGGEDNYGEPEIDRVVVYNDNGTEKRDIDNQLIYQEVDIGQKRDIYLQNSIGPILGYSETLEHSFWYNIYINENKQIVLKDPTLISSFKKGQWIIICDLNDDNLYKGERHQIENISEGTYLITKFLSKFSQGEYRLHSGRYQGDQPRQLYNNSYMSLKIPTVTKVHSNNTNLHKSFAIIPIDHFSPVTNVTPQLEFTKNFSHPRPRITELSFKFQNSDGSLVNFQGREHYMMLRVEVSGQSLKYFTT